MARKNNRQVTGTTATLTTDRSESEGFPAEARVSHESSSTPSPPPIAQQRGTATMVAAKPRSQLAKAPNVEPAEYVPSRPVVRIGLDLGTNTTVIEAPASDDPEAATGLTIIPTVVGYPKKEIFDGLLGTNNQTLYGEQAITNKLHVDLVWPLQTGVVNELEAAQNFLCFVRSQIDAEHKKEVWAVVGMPANADPESRRLLRRATSEAFERVIFVPEPFLAALGLRDEARRGEEGYVDPTANSLFVDIGAGTTDLCKVQGYFPGDEDQLSMPIAGNDVDRALTEKVSRMHPDLQVPAVRITRIKEENSFVGTPIRRAMVTLPVNGKPQRFDFTNPLGQACELLVPPIIQAISELVSRCDVDSVEGLLKNIIITGGGSQVTGLCEFIQDQLEASGFATPRARKVHNYKRLVAQGAIKIAMRAKDDQWVISLGGPS